MTITPTTKRRLLRFIFLTAVVVVLAVNFHSIIFGGQASESNPITFWKGMGK